MVKSINTITKLGIIFFVLIFMINRYLVEISDLLYITILVLCIGFIIIGFITDRKNKKSL